MSCIIVGTQKPTKHFILRSSCLRSSEFLRLFAETLRELLFLTHNDAQAPAAAMSEEGGKSVQTLRSIDLQTRPTDLGVYVCNLCIATRHL